MAFGIRPIFVPIRGVDEFSRTFGQISKKMQGVGKALSNTGSSLTRKVTLPLVGIGAAALLVAGDFESSMNQVQAITNETSEVMSEMSSMARELGATTQFSASEAAQGMTFLSMAGFDANETMQALPGTLQLAAAAGTDLGTAADIASNILTSFGAEASQLGRVNDILANTFTNTNTNMLQLADAMKFVAPVASAMGIRMEETAAAIGLLGNAGIQGSMAGTTLRGSLSRLAAPSREAVKILQKLRIRRDDILDSEGNIKSLIDVVKTFEDAGASASDMLEIFGDRAGPGMAALVRQGSSALAEQTSLNEKSGTAARVAEARMKGFQGQLKKLKSAAQEAAISLGEAGLLDAATKIVEKLTGMARAFGELQPSTQKFLLVAAAIAAAIGPALWILGQLISSLGVVAGVAAKSALFLKPLIPIIMGIKGAFLGVVAPIALFIGSIWSIINTTRLVIDAWDEFMYAISSKFNFLQTLDFFLQDIAESFSKLFRAIPFAGKLADFFEMSAKGFEISAAERAAGQFGGGTINTNNAVVDINVKSEGVPVRAERRAGTNVNLRTDIGMAYQGA